MPILPRKGCRAQGQEFHNVPYANQTLRQKHCIWYVEHGSRRYGLMKAAVGGLGHPRR